MLVQSGGFSAQDTVRGTNGLSSIIGYRNGTILATLNLHVPQCLPSSSSLIRLTLLKMSFEKITRWARWQPSWISECMDFSYSESLYCPDASNHISAQSNFQFGRRCPLKNFKNILEILYVNIAPMPPVLFRLKLTSGSWGVFFFFFLNNFKMVAMAVILDIGTEGL